jgi:hypothetical protein
MDVAVDYADPTDPDIRMKGLANPWQCASLSTFSLYAPDTGVRQLNLLHTRANRIGWLRCLSRYAATCEDEQRDVKKE